MKSRHTLLCFCLVLIPVAVFGWSGSGTLTKAIGYDSEVGSGTVPEAESLLMMARKIEENDPATSEILARRVRLFAMKSNNPLLRIKAQLQLATLLINSTHYPEALRVALQVKELAESLDADYELGCYYETVGKIQSNTGDYNESLQNFYRALNYFDKQKDHAGRGRVLNAIGIDFFRQKDLERAMAYYTRAAAIAVLTRDSTLMGRVWNNMGGVLLQRNDVPHALIKFNASLDLQLKSGMNLKLGIIQMNLACLYRRTGQTEEALELFTKAMALFGKFDNYLHQALCWINLSIYYEDKGDDEKWLGSLRNAYVIGDKYGLKGVLLEAADGLQDYFERHSRIDSAYRYSVMKASIRQTIENERTTSRLTVAELQYQFDKRNAEQTIRQQRQNIVMVMVVMTLITLVLITLLIISRQRRRAAVAALEKKGLTDELEFKNRELALQVINLMKRNEFIIDTSRRMMEINIDQQPGDMKEEVMKIAKSLQDQTDKEIWEEFELRFKQVHSGFYERLLVKFPDLTPNDLKICGLLRLNLTTKEISELTGQRKEAIEMARFRLRKHLGLNDPQINLVTFLGKI